MGFKKEYLKELIEIINSLGILNGNVALIGNLEIFGDKGEEPKRAKKEMKKYFNDWNIISYDLNGRADVRIDLSKPIPKELKNFFDLIIDSGTIEHIFDQYGVFKNIYDMCKINGYILIIEPINSPRGHSYYDYDRKLFLELAKLNNLDIVVDYKISVEITPEGNIQKIIRSDDISKYDYLNHFFIFKKKSDDPFKVPYDLDK